MKFLKNIRAWQRNFFRKRRFNMLNATDNSEEWHMHLSPASIFAAFVSFALLLFILILTLVAYSPVLEFLPGYRTEADRSRESLVQNIIRLDSMERMMNDMLTYNQNIALIMEGKTPVARVLANSDSTRATKVLVMPSPEDSVLRAQMEGDGEYAVTGRSGGSRRSVREAIEPGNARRRNHHRPVRHPQRQLRHTYCGGGQRPHSGRGQRDGGAEPLDPRNGLHGRTAARRESAVGLQGTLAVAGDQRADHPCGRA